MRRFILLLTVSLLFLALAAGPALAVQAKNIAVSKVTSTSVTLVIKSDVATDVTVDYGSAPGTYGSVGVGAGQIRHEVELTGLAPSSVIYYQVTITDSANAANTLTLPEKSFRTSRAPGESFSFAVAGDNRPASNTTVQPAAWNTVVGLMDADGTDLMLDVGDIIYGVSTDSLAMNQAKYDGFFAVTSQFTESAPLYQAVGNHEYVNYANNKTGYETEFTLPVNNGAGAGTYGEHYYSFDNGDTHFVALSTEIPSEQGKIIGDQLAWLTQDLATNDSQWLVVFMHRPLFSGRHASDPWVDLSNASGQQNKTDVHALLRQYGADLVFEGHDHYYLRHEEDGIQYIITGGGGAPLGAVPPLGAGDVVGASAYHYVNVDETADSLDVAVISSAGATLDSFSIDAPSLELSHERTYWQSYEAFLLRELSVDYDILNRGPGDALDLQIQYLAASNGVTATAIPPITTDLTAGASVPFTVTYAVPEGVNIFRATTYVTCSDLRGAGYAWPGQAPSA